jgi:hypothetical protein
MRVLWVLILIAIKEIKYYSLENNFEFNRIEITVITYSEYSTAQYSRVYSARVMRV